MCCSLSLILNSIINEQKIHQLNDYFASLVGSAPDRITVSKVAAAINVTSEVARTVLVELTKNKMLKTSYAIKCPECHVVIKRIDSLRELPQDEVYCYACEEEVEVSLDDVEVLYSLNNKEVFTKGQQKKDESEPASTVVQEDTLRNLLLAGNINDFFFHPSDQEYDKLLQMASDVRSNKKTTVEKGSTLENLTNYLFNLVEVFNAAGVRTTTNQIDCCVRNKLFLNYGVFSMIGLHFFIECKNEAKTPSGTYMSKLESIMDVYNAGTNGEGMKFGIIISKMSGPATFHALAVKYYLMHKIVIIAISLTELETLFKKKGNILDLIEQKIFEIKSDATSDLDNSGLY